jgi:hypothetical protein
MTRGVARCGTASSPPRTLTKPFELPSLALSSINLRASEDSHHQHVSMRRSQSSGNIYIAEGQRQHAQAVPRTIATASGSSSSDHPWTCARFLWPPGHQEHQTDRPSSAHVLTRMQRTRQSAPLAKRFLRRRSWVSAPGLAPTWARPCIRSASQPARRGTAQ